MTTLSPWSVLGSRITIPIPSFRPFATAGFLETLDVNHLFQVVLLQFGHLGSGSLAFTIPIGPCRACDLMALSHPGFPNMLFSLLAFAAR
jgi:hypothetical protein